MSHSDFEIDIVKQCLPGCKYDIWVTEDRGIFVYSSGLYFDINQTTCSIESQLPIFPNWKEALINLSDSGLFRYPYKNVGEFYGLLCHMKQFQQPISTLIWTKECDITRPQIFPKSSLRYTGTWTWEIDLDPPIDSYAGDLALFQDKEESRLSVEVALKFINFNKLVVLANAAKKRNPTSGKYYWYKYHAILASQL